MNCPDAISSLNRLVHLMLRSFPAYSAEVRLVTYRGSEETFDLLKRIAEEQRLLGERISQAIRELKGAPDPGQFSIEFTAWNDVALSRIAERSLDRLAEVAAEAEAIADLDPHPPVFHFAREVLNLTKQHVELLEKASAIKSSSTA